MFSSPARADGSEKWVDFAERFWHCEIVSSISKDRFKLMSDVDLKSYTDTAYHSEELKSLTRYRFDKVRARAKLKQSVARLVNILFPELEKLVPSLHVASVYALLSELPGAYQIASCNLTHLKTILVDASKGRYGRDKSIEIRDAVRQSVGSRMPAKSLELQHTIRLIQEMDMEIGEIEVQIEAMMVEIHSPIITIPGIGTRMGAMILAEIGDFSQFNSPDKILAYAGLSPSIYQSGHSAILSYLSDLELHNDREWYHAHKMQYQEANAEFIDMLQQHVLEIGNTDSSVIK